MSGLDGYPEGRRACVATCAADPAETDVLTLMPEVAEMPLADLREYALLRARTIVAATPGDDGASWDDPEEWQDAAAELAHAFIRLLSAQATTYEEGMATRWQAEREPS